VAACTFPHQVEQGKIGPGAAKDLHAYIPILNHDAPTKKGGY